MLRSIHADPRLDLRLLVTGEHLVATFGRTGDVICRGPLAIGGRVDMLLAADTPSGMATGIGVAIIGMTRVLETLDPDIVLLFGDRGEMLAGAIVAVHLRKFVAHIHGGELSGTVDGSVRHAISKLAHFHFTATAAARERLLLMGEPPDCVFNVGAPGLDVILSTPTMTREQVCAKFGLDPSRPWALLIYHPDTMNANGDDEISAVLDGLERYKGQVVMFGPNSDAGRQAIADQLHARGRADAVLLQTVPREDFLGLLANAEVMVGNSSSGIIEAPSFGVPVVNVGHRQDGRDRGDNVVDVPPDAAAIAGAVEQVCGSQAFRCRLAERRNQYGDGQAGLRIAALLAELPLDPARLQKRPAW